MKVHIRLDKSMSRGSFEHSEHYRHLSHVSGLRQSNITSSGILPSKHNSTLSCTSDPLAGS